MKITNVPEALSLIQNEQLHPGSIDRTTLEEAISLLVGTTSETYSRQSGAYAQARTAQPWVEDARMATLLLSSVRSRISGGTLSLPQVGGKWKMIDVGAGYGRDALAFSNEPDISVMALENAAGFVTCLNELVTEGKLPKDSIINSDMRNMAGIQDSTIQCVRNHATLHHLPLLGPGSGADSAVSESRRVLTKGGVLYVLVKGGEGVDMIDTKEGLGGRFFQLFTPTTLSELLERHNFNVFHIEELEELRGGTPIPWVFALAEAS